MPGRKVPERRSGLRYSENKLQERRSVAYHHKNTPAYRPMSLHGMKGFEIETTALLLWNQTVHHCVHIPKPYLFRSILILSSNLRVGSSSE
jgi:hypothetical protein